MVCISTPMKLHTIVATAILIVLVSIPIFGHLDSIPLQLWDESRLADHAMAMIRTHNWIVTQYDGQPDMWMTKPPMMVWLQVISMKLLGYNELAVRLPAAIAALLTCLLLFGVFTKRLQDPGMGMITCMVLVTTHGYVILHGTRTGEYDSLLTLCTTAYLLYFFLYMEEGRQRHLAAMFAFLAGAALTKGIQALIFLPVLPLYAVYRGRVMMTLKSRTFYAGLASFVVLVAGYYLLREHYNPGFIKTMWENEIGGRYNTVIESHGGDDMNYLKLLMGTYFPYWYVLVIPGLITGVFSKEQFLRNISVFIALAAAAYLLIISNAKTQLDWYLLPLYPLLSILSGIFIYTCYQLLAGINKDVLKEVLNRNVMPWMFLVLLFYVPYRESCTYIMSDESNPFMERERNDMARYMRKMLRHQTKAFPELTILKDDLSQDMDWYKMVFEEEKRKVKWTNREEVNEYTTVAAFKPASKQYLQDKYNTEVCDTLGGVTVYKLNGLKKAGDGLPL